jgi:hypothetical protein
MGYTQGKVEKKEVVLISDFRFKELAHQLVKVISLD